MTEIARPPETSSEAPAPPPEAPASLVPEAAWIEAEAEARALVETLDETMQAQWKQWRAATASDVLDPLYAIAQQAAATHRRLAEEAAFEDADAPPGEVWRRATGYRQAVAETVMAPLRGFLAHRKLGDLVGAGCLNTLETLTPFVEDAPSHLTLPRPLALYAPEPEDRLLRRTGKSYVRARHRLRRAYLFALNGLRRLLRLEPVPLRAQGRLTPLRALCAYHAQVRLPAQLIPLHETAQQHVARLVARLETALTDWTHAALDAERRLDRVAFHQPSVLQTLYAAEDDETPEEPVASVMIDAFSSAAAALQQALQDVVEAAALPEDLAAEEALRAAAAGLAEDLRCAGAGKFLLHPKTRKLPPPDRQPAARLQARRQNWAAWHKQAVGRLDLNGQLMTLRKALLGLEDALLQQISDAALRPVLQTFQPVAQRLREAEQRAARACDDAAATDDRGALEAALHALQTQTMEALQQALSDLPGLVSADQALVAPGRAEWATFQEMVQTLPEQVSIHPLPRTTKDIDPEKRPSRMDVRQGAQEILLPFDEQLAEPAQPLRKEIVRVWSETEQIGHIVQYNLDAALEVLNPEAAEEKPAEREAETPSKDPVEDARELATDGLRRAADALTDLARSLETPWDAFAGVVFDLFQKDWADVHRVARTEAFVEGLSFWMRARRWVPRSQRRVKEWWQTSSKMAALQFRRLRRSAKVLIERGRSAMGTVEATEEDRLRTIDAISPASVRSLQGRLPLVYRKLFSLRPVTEPSLLEGRRDDLKRINQHVHRWKAGQSAGALILAMPLGSGRTSLLNSVAATLRRVVDVRMLSLTRRLADASDFAACVAEALGIEVIGEPSLDAVEAQLLDAPCSEPPRVCLIDNLEHLLLRTFGGSDLVERVLIFFSRTDVQVCWIATTGAYAWRFLEQTMGMATGLVTAYQPAQLDNNTLKDIILNRHQRSGMALRFTEPKDLSPLARRRVSRARTPEDQQAILREVYFDRLFRHSGQNVMLALYYWLCSTDFEAEEGLLTLQPIEPLSFRFFESFDMARAFTMKAFVLHNTLTLDEHNRIFRMTDDESTYLLESLLNLRLIEPCSPEARRDASGSPSRILSDERYRLHPLILHPTSQLLKERNIIH